MENEVENVLDKRDRVMKMAIIYPIYSGRGERGIKMIPYTQNSFWLDVIIFISYLLIIYIIILIIYIIILIIYIVYIERLLIFHVDGACGRQGEESPPCGESPRHNCAEPIRLRRAERAVAASKRARAGLRAVQEYEIVRGAAQEHGEQEQTVRLLSTERSSHLSSTASEIELATPYWLAFRLAVMLQQTASRSISLLHCCYLSLAIVSLAQDVMAAPHRRGSRVNPPRGYEVVKQNMEPARQSDWFSIRSYGSRASLQGPLTSIGNMPTQPGPVSDSVNKADTQPGVDHSQCANSINGLKQQIALLKKENALLESDLRAASAELAQSRLQLDRMRSDISILESTKAHLESEIVTVKKNYDDLLQEFNVSRDQWEAEREGLERSLKEIKKELENKIVEIRAKHEQEIQTYEEKNRLLKIHLADVLKMRSDERQSELDRISNDLEKSQTNEENLRVQFNKLVKKLNQTSKSDPQVCGNCLVSLNLTSAKESQFLDKKIRLENSWKTGPPRRGSPL